MSVKRRESKTAMTVRDLMSKRILDCEPQQSLTEAAARMRSERVSALALVVGDEIVGVITERDLMRAITDGRDPSMVHISEYMTQSPHTIEAHEEARHAASIMIKHRVRHLPVTEHGRLAGFLSARDLLALEPWPVMVPVVEPW